MRVGTAESLPRGWTSASLGQLGDYLNGRAFKKDEWSDKGRVIIRIQDLTGSGSAPNRFEGSVESRYEVRRGDFLISWAATLGAFRWAGSDAVLNQHIFKVNSFIDKAFHFYLVQAILADLQRQAHGSGMVHITKSKFDQTRVQVPPLAEQHRIVAAIEEHLSRLDAAVAALERVRAALSRYRAAVLKAACEGRLVGTEVTPAALWSQVTVGQVATEVRYGTSAKASENGNGVPVLRMGNIVDGGLDVRSLKFLPREHDEFPALLLERGDVLFNRTNSPELVGKTAVYRGTPSPCSFASYLIRIRLAPDCLPDFLAFTLNSVVGRDWIRSVVSQQVGQANVSGGKLKNFSFTLPPVTDQQRIVAEVDRRLSLADAAERAVSAGLVKAKRLRQAILKRAFEGKLAPQDPNDEPASVLLEQIRAVRASAAPTAGPREGRRRKAAKK